MVSQDGDYCFLANYDVHYLDILYLCVVFSRLSFIGRLLCKAPVNLLETERYINFNIIIIIIIDKITSHIQTFKLSTFVKTRQLHFLGM